MSVNPDWDGVMKARARGPQSAAPPRDVLRRTVVLPPDLFLALEHLARRDGFQSVQAWLACRMQEYADGRAADLPEYMRICYG